MSTENQGIADNFCDIMIEPIKCSFLWTIGQYSILWKRDDQLKSSTFSAVGHDFKWHLALETRNYSNGGQNVYLYLNPDFDDLEKYGPVTVKGEIFVMMPNNTKFMTREVFFKFDYDGVDRCYSFLLGNVHNILPRQCKDGLKIVVELGYFKESNIVTRSSSCCPKLVKFSESNLSRDFERFFIDDDNFKDVTISVKDKNYLAHKQVLAARSSVFNAMFRNDMQESQKNRIVITDIDQEIFEEVLHYIYTGKTEKLEEFAFELLPVADKYDLKELKIMCEEVLVRKLSTDNAAKILILADMHHAEVLKVRTLRFIVVKNSKCKDFKETEIWNILYKSRPQLMKDLLDIIFDE